MVDGTWIHLRTIHNNIAIFSCVYLCRCQLGQYQSYFCFSHKFNTTSTYLPFDVIWFLFPRVGLCVVLVWILYNYYDKIYNTIHAVVYHKKQWILRQTCFSDFFYNLWKNDGYKNIFYVIFALCWFCLSSVFIRLIITHLHPTQKYLSFISFYVNYLFFFFFFFSLGKTHKFSKPHLRNRGFSWPLLRVFHL